MNETGKEPDKPPNPVPTTPVSATPTPTKNESGNNRRGNRRVNLRHGNEGGTSGLEKKDFKGETPKLNAVLGLITERMKQGVNFDKLQDVLKNYALKNYHKAEDIVEMVTDLNDPFPNFENKHMPRELTKTEEESKMKMKMWEMRVKTYIDREEVLEENANKLYGIVIGQCTPPLRLTIKGDAEYGKTSSDFDTSWL